MTSGVHSRCQQGWMVMQGQHTPQRQNQGRKRLPWIRVTIASIALLCFAAIALLWILNVEYVIQGNWSVVLSIVFTILGVVFVFCAWLFPFPPDSPALSARDSTSLSRKIRPQDKRPPPIWNVPYLRNFFFTGRKKLLIDLHSRFNTSKMATSPRTQVISGLGGIGKTQIALEYAYRYRSEYRDVLWINAATRETLIAGLVNVAVSLEL